MTLICPYMYYCIRPAVPSKPCLCNFHQTHLKFCSFSSYVMKMCMWFWSFSLTIYDGVVPHINLDFVCLSKILFKQLLLLSSDSSEICRLSSLIFFFKHYESNFLFNPIALREAKIAYNFGLSECSRVNANPMFGLNGMNK